MERQKLYELSLGFTKKENSTFSQSDKKILSKIISLHGDLYYNDENPVISDSDYDILFKKHEYFLAEAGEQINIFEKSGESFAQSSFKKVAHSRSMISLDNTYNADELRDFDVRIKRILNKPHPNPLLKEREQATRSQEILQPLSPGGERIQEGGYEEFKIPYTIEFKFDGLGIELVYEDGVLVRAITRGNGVEGEDVTENIKQIKNIPKKINKPGIFEVRGEVVMPISSFERLNKEALEAGEKVFSNPRNAASGSLRVLDTSITKKRDLQYFAYDVSDFTEFSNDAYSSMIYQLQGLGFEISSYFPECEGIEQVISMIENIGDIKKTLDFEIDGLVVKLNDIALWKDIGSTEHHPRYAIAYKFPAEIVTTKLESVEHSVGRTGTITPVANLEAVNIAGAMIRRATLHNYDEVEKLGVRVGDHVFLKRAGEVIPKIISVASSPHPTSPYQGEEQTVASSLLTKERIEGGLILPPTNCPSCGSGVIKDDEKVRYYCPNAYGCPAQMKEKLAFAVGKQGFNIDGFGEKQAELFYRLDYITKFGDIFRLKNYRDEILLLEGFKEKSVNNLLDGIEKVRNTDIVTFLKALGIPGVGKKTAKTLGKYVASNLTQSQLSTSFQLQNSRSTPFFTCLNSFPGKGKEAIEKLQNLPDIGPEVAESMIEFFHSQSEMIDDLLGELNIIIPLSSKGNKAVKGKYVGKKMCITGSFEGYKRDQLAEILEQQGGEFMSSVSVKTDYLLAGEKAGSKLKKAQELGVEVLSLENFFAE